MIQLLDEFRGDQFLPQLIHVFCRLIGLLTPLGDCTLLDGRGIPIEHNHRLDTVIQELAQSKDHNVNVGVIYRLSILGPCCPHDLIQPDANVDRKPLSAKTLYRYVPPMWLYNSPEVFNSHGS